MAWIKSFHIIFMVTWFAGIFYLPRLFVYHAMANDAISIDRFKIMERKLFWGIATPSAVLTIFFGLWIVALWGWSSVIDQLWLLLKLIVVVLLIAYHGWCGKLLSDFKADRNRHSHVWYRWFNELPVLFLIAIILLVEIKPFSH